MLVEIISEPLVYVMLDLPAHLPDLIVEDSYHLQVRSLKLRALIVHGAVGLHERTIRILNTTCLTLVQSFEGL